MRHRLLQSLCSAWERHEGGTQWHVVRYPSDAIRPFEQAGLVQFAGVDSTCGCQDCHDIPHGGCVGEAVAPDADGQSRYLVSCPREGLFIVPENRLYSWRPVYGMAVARYLAGQLGCRGAIEERISGHLWRLGQAALGDYLLPCYLALGCRNPEAVPQVQRDPGLTSQEPVLLFVPANIPSAFGPSVHVRALRDYLTTSEQTLDFNLPALYAGLRVLPSLTPRQVKPVHMSATATWSEVCLTVVNPYCLTIRYAGQEETQSYDELGFTDRKRPLAAAEQETFGAHYAWNDYWEHFLRLAAADGEISMESWGRGATRNTVAGWRREITKRLVTALGIHEGEFLYYSRRDGCYRTNARLTMTESCRKEMLAMADGRR